MKQTRVQLHKHLNRMENAVVWTFIFVVTLHGVCGESMDQSDSVVKRPGETVKMSCVISGFDMTSYYIHWIRQRPGQALVWIGRMNAGINSPSYGSSFQSRFTMTEDVPSSSQFLQITGLTTEDSAVYFCAREGYYNVSYFDYWGKGTTVTVTSATTTGPSVFPLIQCGSGTGGMITLGCLATGFTPSSLTFKWTKDGTALTDFIQYPAVQKDNAYTEVSQIRVSSQDWENRNVFQCAAEHAGGNAQTTFTPPNPPLYKLPSLRVLASSSSDDTNEATFSCLASDFSPKDYKLKWQKNDVDIAEKNHHDTPVEGTTTENGTLYSVSSFLTVKVSEAADSKFTCLFEGKIDKNVKGFVNASVLYKEAPNKECTNIVDIKIIPPKMEDIFQNRKGTAICLVTADKPSVEKIYWENARGKELAATGPQQTNGGKQSYRLSLDVTYDEWSKGLELYCVVVHSEALEPIKELYQRVPGRPTQRPSVFMLSPVEQLKSNKVTLTCYVKDFFPEEVFVSWLVDDEEASSEYKFSTTEPIRDNGLYYAYGHLSLTVNQWQDSDKVYSCVVYHESQINATKAIVRSIGHRTFEKTNLVNLNINIPENKPQ